MINKLRNISQVLFIAVFAFLVVQGNVQAWILLLGLGWLVSLVLGRKYCGWVCPMGILMRFQTWIYKKLKISRIQIPKLNESPRIRALVIILRLIMLAVFLMGMVAVRVWGMQINVILYLVIIGVGISFFFTEDFWHRICPHGAILNITSRISPFGMKIDRSNCNGCSLCEKECPNQAISKYNNTKQRVIDNKECLVCYDCQKVCPKNAISYGKHDSYQEQEKEAVNS